MSRVGTGYPDSTRSVKSPRNFPGGRGCRVPVRSLTKVWGYYYRSTRQYLKSVCFEILGTPFFYYFKYVSCEFDQFKDRYSSLQAA